MAVEVATATVHTIVKEVVGVGAVLSSLYKAFKNQLQQSAGDARRGASRLPVGSMNAVEQVIQKVSDSQASLLALVSQGAFEICNGGLGTLQSATNKAFDSVLQSIQDESAIQAARELKTKLDLTSLASNRMLEGIVEATESAERRFSPGFKRDIDRAERSASELSTWAKSFVPDNPRAMSRQSKLQMVPYIVALAYAALIQGISYILKRDIVDQESDKIACLKRARKVEEDFMAVLAGALEGIMTDTNLLEVAIDYQLPMAMFLTLMTTFYASVGELLAPNPEHKEVVVWDDGLEPIRNLLHWRPRDAGDDQDQTIELDTIAESVWWATFMDVNLAASDMSTMRTSIHICEICYELGMGDDDWRIPHIAVIPGQKRALTQLPSVRTLRATLCANIAQVRQALPADRPWPAPPRSFARTSKPPPPDDDPLLTADLPPVNRRAAAARTLSGHTRMVMSVAVSADGAQVLSGSWDTTARVWSLSSGQHLRTLSGHTSYVNCVAVSSDGKTAVSGSSDKSVCVWSVESGRVQRSFVQAHSASVWAVAVSSDGRSVASSSADKTIKLWNVESAECQGTLTGHSSAVMCVALSPDGATLVSGSHDKSIRVWSTRNGKLMRCLIGHLDDVLGVAVTPDGSRVVSGSGDGTVKVWTLSSGALEMSFEGHIDYVRCVAVFPDGERIASGSGDSTVRVWNLRRRALERTFRGHSELVQCVAVTPDGRSVVSGSSDKTIKVWAWKGGGDSRVEGPVDLTMD